MMFFALIRWAFRKCGILSLCCVLLQVQARGVERDLSRLHFEPLEVAEAAPSGAVGDIVQGPDGFIWFGTKEGAHRFDGYEVRTYKQEKGNDRSIVSNIVLTFHVDDLERLWLGTEHGLSRYEEETDDFRNYLLDTGDLNSNLANHVNAIVQDSMRRIYVSSESGYIYRYQESQDRFERVNEEPMGIIKSMVADDEDRLWVGASSVLYRFNPEDGEVLAFEEPFETEDPSERNFIESICFVDASNIWLGTERMGALRFDSITGTATRMPQVHAGESYVHMIKQDAAGDLWIGHSDGLTLVDKENGELLRYHPDMIQGAPPRSAITSAMTDSQGNVWLGSQFHGVFVSTNNKDFRRLDEYYGKGSGERAVIASLLYDREGNLWIGHNSTGIDIFPADGGPVRRLRHQEGEPRSLPLNTIFTLFEDSRGEIWAGGYRSGLLRYDKESQLFDAYVHDMADPESIAGNDVRSIAEDERGNFWILTHGKGLTYFDREAETFTLYSRDEKNPEETLIDDWGGALLYSGTGDLYVGTQVGLSVFDTKEKRFTNYVAKPNDAGSLSSSVVNTLFEDSLGRIWVGTSDGIDLFDTEAKRFTSWSTEHGLPSRSVTSIVEDDAGVLWIGTDSGLARFETEGMTIRAYDEGDGLTDGFCYRNAAIKGEGGQLFFGTKNGVTYFDPRNIVENTLLPKVMLTDFKVSNRSLPIEPGSGDPGVLDRSIWTTDTVVLTPEQKVISIEFVGLNYVQPRKNRYAYRLLGFDEAWSYAGTRREATYTNLNPGRYVFQVKASNNDGYWNEQPRELEIVVQPPFWKSVWFRSLLVVAIVLLPGLLVYWRVSSIREQQRRLSEMVEGRTSDLRKANEKLERAYSQLEKNQFQIQLQNRELMTHRQNLELMVSQRTQELEAAKEKAERSDRLKSAFLANMSHEIRTPMNAIIGLLDILQLETLSEEEREQYNDVIKQSSTTLMTLIDDILDLSRIESGEATVTPQVCNVDEICEELFALFRHLAISESNGAIEMRLLRDGVEGALKSGRTDLRLCGIDPIRLKQVLTNLLSNAIKFTDEGVVDFGYESEKDEGRLAVRFFVEDTGIGIPEDQQSRVFERFHKVDAQSGRVYRGTGLGLTISQKLVGLMNGSISLSSTVGKGTRFTVSFERELTVEEGLLAGGDEIALAREEETVGLRGLSVLVAEDEEPNFLVIKKYLQRIDARCHWVKDGGKAIAAFKEEAFDLVLLDVKMPVLGGFEVLEYIRSVDTEIPVIVQTAYAMDADRKKAMEMGASDFLAKPFYEEGLISCIERCLRSRQT